MSPSDWASLFFLSSITLSVTSVALFVAWLRARERAVRAEARLEQQRVPVQLPQSDRSGREIDAIAAEVARLGEGQEFLVQLLRERSTVQAGVVVHRAP